MGYKAKVLINGDEQASVFGSNFDTVLQCIMPYLGAYAEEFKDMDGEVFTLEIRKSAHKPKEIMR